VGLRVLEFFGDGPINQNGPLQNNNNSNLLTFEMHHN
jgi:hypothetical protein